MHCSGINAWEVRTPSDLHALCFQCTRHAEVTKKVLPWSFLPDITAVIEYSDTEVTKKVLSLSVLPDPAAAS